MRTTPRNKRSGGYSLMELLIVAAIIIVTVTFFITGIRLIFTSPSRQCSRQLKAAIEKTRIDTMGRNAAGLKVYAKTDGIYVEELYSGDQDVIDKQDQSLKKIGSRRVTVEYSNSESGGRTTLNSTGITLAFKRDTGGFYSSGEEVGSSGDNAVFVNYIWTRSGGKEYKLTLHKLTGAVDLRAEDIK